MKNKPFFYKINRGVACTTRGVVSTTKIIIIYYLKFVKYFDNLSSPSILIIIRLLFILLALFTIQCFVR